MIKIFEMFQIPFMQRALVLSMVTGAFLSFLGVYVVLRRIVFVGICLSQISACGFAFGFLIGFDSQITSFAFVLLGILFFSFIKRMERLPQESITGMIYALFAALSLLFVAKSAGAEASILNILSGDILTITEKQVYMTAGVIFLAAFFHYLFYRKFLFISFDPETAVSTGINVKLYEFLFYFILGTVISFAIRSAGVLLTFGYLAAPASLALLFRERMKDVFLFAVLTGLSATLIGLVLSFFWDLPSGTTIVALMGIAWFAGYIFKR